MRSRTSLARTLTTNHIVSQADGGAHSRDNCVVLCTTHHRLLHEGKLTIAGDADRDLEVRGSSGARIGERATQRGSAPPITC